MEIMATLTLTGKVQDIAKISASLAEIIGKSDVKINGEKREHFPSYAKVFDDISYEIWFLIDVLLQNGRLDDKSKDRIMSFEELTSYQNNDSIPFESPRTISARVGGANRVCAKNGLPEMIKIVTLGSGKSYRISEAIRATFDEAESYYEGGYSEWLNQESNNFIAPGSEGKF